MRRCLWCGWQLLPLLVRPDTPFAFLPICTHAAIRSFTCNPHRPKSGCAPRLHSCRWRLRPPPPKRTTPRWRAQQHGWLRCRRWRSCRRHCRQRSRCGWAGAGISQREWGIPVRPFLACARPWLAAPAHTSAAALPPQAVQQGTPLPAKAAKTRAPSATASAAAAAIASPGVPAAAAAAAASAAAAPVASPAAPAQASEVAAAEAPTAVAEAQQQVGGQ